MTQDMFDFMPEPIQNRRRSDKSSDPKPIDRHWHRHLVQRPGHCDICLAERVDGTRTTVPHVATFKRKHPDTGQWQFYCSLHKEGIERAEQLAAIEAEQRRQESEKARDRWRRR